MKVQHFALYVVGLVVVLALASLFDLSWAGLVPVLVLLGCPLLMLLMMRGMNYSQSEHDSGDRSRDGHGSNEDAGAGRDAEPPAPWER